MLKNIVFSIVFVLSLFFSTILFAENVITNKPRVYLLLGQSNMAGQGLISELNDQQKGLSAHVKLYLHGKPVSLSSLNKFGPEVSFSQTLSHKYPDTAIHLIKFAPGGYLMKDWTSRERGKHYDTLIKQVKKASGGVMPKVNGVLWMHGERDTKSKQLGNAYKEGMHNFIKMLKSDFKNNKLPIALARISIPSAFRPAVAEVRLAQEYISQSSSSVHLISTDDLSKRSDKVHFDTKGQLVLGRRFAKVFMNN